MHTRNLAAGLLLALAATIVAYVFFSPGSWRIPGTTPLPPETSAPDEPVATPYTPRDWKVTRSSELNVSVFIYRDRNRSGDYDEGDLPMPGVAVNLIKPAGKPEREQSNVNGYTNFRMHNNADGSGIDRAGAFFHFEVEIPPGWRVTSGNARQSSRFRALPGSPAGLVAESPPDTVGLAPVLTISGTIEPVATLVSLRAIAPSGGRLPVEVDPSGHFALPAHAGDWQFEARFKDHPAPLTRRVTVRDVPVALSAIVAGQAATAAPETAMPMPINPRPITENFDALPYSIIEKLPRGHHGLDWDYLLAVDNQTYRGPGYVNGMVSPPGVGYNSSGHPVTVAALSPGDRFDFTGGYFSVAWPESEGETLELQAWRGPELAYSDRIGLSYLGPVWFQADYRDIDRLSLATTHYWQFVTDDLQFRLHPPGQGDQVKAANDIPWLSQYSIFPQDTLAGDVMCGPAAGAMALTQLGVVAASAPATVSAARLLAGDRYLRIARQDGTSPQELMEGLVRYAGEHERDVDFISYAGWRPIAGPGTRAHQVSRDWVAAALDNGAAVLLNIGAYAQQADRSLTRIGGHWVNLRAVDGDSLLVHDPAPANVKQSGHRVSIQDERLLAQDANRTLFYRGDTGALILDGLPRPEAADTLALDAAIALRVSLP